MIEFRIADTFIDSLGRLTGEEQKAVKTTAFDFQLNPAHPGHQFHKLDRARDKRFWSVRVSSDVRLIIHRTDSSLLLCYVDHHVPAYAWAERRKLEVHPKTGAAQLVEIRERIEEIVVPVYIAAKAALFAQLSDDQLLGFGVPTEWLADVRALTDENALLALTDHIPKEAGEALLDLATGVTPKAVQPAPPGADPFTHPDAERRFRAMRTAEELERAFNSAWDKWRRPASVRRPRARKVQTPNLNDQGQAALPVCDWVYFATSSPEDFATTRNLVREFGMIIRTVFNSAGIRIANVKQLQQGDTILLVHGGGRSKVPYRPMFSCTVVAPSRPVPNFDGFSFPDENQQVRLRNSGYSPDPHLRMFTGISIDVSKELEHLTCSIPRPLGINTLRRWNEVFGGISA